MRPARRKRCPYCKSLNTAECCAATKDGVLTMDGHVCDDCDMSFDIQRFIDGKWVRVPNETMEKP